MTGCFVADLKTVVEQFDHWYWACDKPNVTNEELPLQLPTLVDALEELVRSDYKRFCPKGSNIEEFKSAFESSLKQLRQLGCNCAAEEGGSCKKACPCHEYRRKCTRWCAGHDFTEGIPTCQPPYLEPLMLMVKLHKGKLCNVQTF